jgi:hypothetical protein
MHGATRAAAVLVAEGADLGRGDASEQRERDESDDDECDATYAARPAGTVQTAMWSPWVAICGVASTSVT